MANIPRTKIGGNIASVLSINGTKAYRWIRDKDWGTVIPDTVRLRSEAVSMLSILQENGWLQGLVFRDGGKIIFPLQQIHPVPNQVTDWAIFFLAALRPNLGHDLLTHEVSRPHTTTHHSR